jgi:hypothetical protein
MKKILCDRLNRDFKKQEIAKCSTVNTHKSILNTVNNTVYDVSPEIGRRSKKNITFSKKVSHNDSSERTLLTFKEDCDVTTAKAESRKARSSPPLMGGAGHFLRLSKSGGRNPNTEDYEFPCRQFLQARNITPKPEGVTEKLEIRKEGFSTPKSEEEEI